MQRGFILCGIFLILCVDRSEAACTGGVVGAIFGTIAFCCIIFGIVLFVLLKKGILKKGEKDKKTPNKAAVPDAAYTNPAFHGDEGTVRAATLSGAELGIGGYVPCAEYESPNKHSKPSPVQPNGGVQKPSWSTTNFRAPGQSMSARTASHGSHGSLDDTFVTNDPEVVSVALQSQDFVGLGFNIWGSMRDGVFVSQVHNRGPAIETGKIKPGDRILDITISFENMVYEDALTILSYASPYPVRLHLQKATPDKDKETEGEETDAEDTVLHPVYRSQSMDDVSKIQKERFSFRMRRARSEMKRGSSKKNEETDTGTLRKWKDMVGLESATPNAVKNPDLAYTTMNIGTNDLMADPNETGHVEREVTVHQHQAPRVLAVDIPDHGKNITDEYERDRVERLRAQIQQEWNDAPEELVGKSKMNVTSNSHNKIILSDAPGNPDSVIIDRRQSDSSASDRSSEFDDVGDDIDHGFLMRALKLSEPDAQIVPDVGEEVEIGNATRDESTLKFTPGKSRLSPHSSSSGSYKESKTAEVEVASNDEYVVVDLSNENNSSAPEVREGQQNASMVVNFSEQSLLMKDDPDVPVEAADEKSSLSEQKSSESSEEEEMMVLKSYLGNRSFLVDNLGSSDDDQAGVANKTVTMTSSDGTTTTETRTQTGHGDVVFETTSSSLEPHGANLEISELSQLKTKALFDAKREIRRRSDSENENQKSDGSSLSSRSSSLHPDDLGMDLSALRQKLSMQPAGLSDQSDTDDGSARDQVSDSPDIKRRSGGGLTFDITRSEFSKMPDEIEPEPRGSPKGGMSYFVSIDDDLRAPKTELYEDSLTQPSLVRAWDPAEGERNRKDSSASEHSEADTRKITFKLPETSGYIEGNNNELHQSSVKHGVNFDMNFNGNSSLDSTPLGSPYQSSSTEVFTKTETSERYTITSHDEAKGTYTMTVNSFDDSEA